MAVGQIRTGERYAKPRNYIKPMEAGHLINGLRIRATLLGNLPGIELSRTPDDNPLLAMAIAGPADYLVTGNKRESIIVGKNQRNTDRNEPRVWL